MSSGYLYCVYSNHSVLTHSHSMSKDKVTKEIIKSYTNTL